MSKRRDTPKTALGIFDQLINLRARVELIREYEMCVVSPDAPSGVGICLEDCLRAIDEMSERAVQR